MLHIFMLLLTTTLSSIYAQNVEHPMEAENRIYVGDFTRPTYSLGSADYNNGYLYHSKYVSFPTTNNNGYQSFHQHSIPTTTPNYETQTLGGYNGHSGYANYAPFNAFQGYNNNYGMIRTYEGSMSSNGNFAPITYSTHRPMIGGLHTSIGAAFGGGMNGVPAYLTNGHYSSYYPYNPLSIIHPYK